MLWRAVFDCGLLLKASIIFEVLLIQIRRSKLHLRKHAKMIVTKTVCKLAHDAGERFSRNIGKTSNYDYTDEEIKYKISLLELQGKELPMTTRIKDLACNNVYLVIPKRSSGTRIISVPYNWVISVSSTGLPVDIVADSKNSLGEDVVGVLTKNGESMLPVMPSKKSKESVALAHAV